MGDVDEDAVRSAIALYFHIPARVISDASFSAFYSMMAMFVSTDDMALALRFTSYYDKRFGPSSLAPESARFIEVWRATGYDPIVYNNGGALFGFYAGAVERIQQLAAVPGLRAHGLDDHALVTAIRESQELSYILEALDSGVPRDYATA